MSCKSVCLAVVLTGGLAVWAPLLTHAQSCVQPPSGIIAWWPFDETSGTTSEDIAGSNDGQHVNDPVPSAGFVGGALDFNGDDYVAVPDSDLWAFGATGFTIEFWANFDVPAHGSRGHPGDVFISNDEGPFNVPKWFFALNSSTLDFLTCCGPGWAFSPNAAFNPEVGRWYHLAVTRSGTDYRIHANGQLIAAGSNSSTIPNINAILTIGRALEPFGGFMNGRLDEMTVYHRALTEGELRAIFEAGGAGKCKQVTITTRALSAVQLGVESFQQLEATSGTRPYSWSVFEGALPPGMSLNVDGVFSGTPTDLGEFRSSVQVVDSAADSATKEFTVEALLVLPPPDIRITKAGTTPVPGRDVDYFILVENRGATTALDLDVLELIDPSVFTLLAVNPPAAVDVIDLAAASIILWQIPSLAPGEAKFLVYKVAIDPSVPIGATIIGGPACVGAQLAQQWLLCVFSFLSVLSTCGDALVCAEVCIEGCALVPPACLPCGLACAALYTLCFTDVSPFVTDCMHALDCDEAEDVTTGPVDPNEKLVLAETFIQPDAMLVYPIHFENIGEVEAIDVFVTDVLDPNLDDSTLQLLTPAGSFDPLTRTVRWELLGLNLQPGATGNVLLSVKPVAGLPSGTSIRNSATIQFEVFEPLVTAPVENIIDTTQPSCTMDALPPETDSSNFPISWSGSDAIGVVESFAIFVSTDGGVFAPILERTLETSSTFPGAIGRTYDFFCVAVDTAGNVEEQVLVAEAVTCVSSDLGFGCHIYVFKDFLACLYGPSTHVPPECGLSDINADGFVDLKDFAILQNVWTFP